ncbi:uncharacterized protein TrAtP1_004318 [Trichoderma atroviride]|uniref:uncharacterized protein n=1 Tax=Hypocrea atroviridis TaxID=63577 RepID=UPI0033336806|nr:hypothetical protein TrAtP1_004318 [Trichoderma atroviride]
MRVLQLMTDQIKSKSLYPNSSNQEWMNVKVSTPNRSSPIYPAPGQAATSPHATVSLLRPYRAAPQPQPLEYA